LIGRAPRRGGAAALGSQCTLVLCALAALLGCLEPDSHGHRYDESGAPVDVAQLGIDAGGEIDLDPGMGVGIGVEYAGAGAWQITSACDTGLSGAVCHFDVMVSELGVAPDGISAVAGVGLEAEDRLTQPDPFSLELDLVTGTDLDGATFSTTPGATVRVEALLYDPVYGSDLDWVAEPRVFYWVGGGALQSGAPTDPVDLTPDRP
jgi:hypothetical protein